MYIYQYYLVSVSLSVSATYRVGERDAIMLPCAGTLAAHIVIGLDVVGHLLLVSVVAVLAGGRTERTREVLLPHV